MSVALCLATGRSQSVTAEFFQLDEDCALTSTILNATNFNSATYVFRGVLKSVTRSHTIETSNLSPMDLDSSNHVPYEYDEEITLEGYASRKTMKDLTNFHRAIVYAQTLVDSSTESAHNYVTKLTIADSFGLDTTVVWATLSGMDQTANKQEVNFTLKFKFRAVFSGTGTLNQQLRSPGNTTVIS
jgi:hypothetical protein